MINTKYNEEQLKKYISECQEKIRLLTDVLSIDSSISKFDILKTQDIRNKMIEQKINHTNRVVSGIKTAALKMGVDIIEIMENAALLHDIGRFEQATWNDNYKDTIYSEINGKVKNHAEAGYDILFNQGKIKNFNFNGFDDIIGDSILYHQNAIIPKHLNGRLSNSEILNIRKFANNLDNHINYEKVSGLTLQLLKDIDMLDILYQNVTGEAPSYLEYFRVDFKRFGRKLNVDEIALKYNLTKEEIISFNDLTSSSLENINYIDVPLYKEESIKQLEVSDEIKSLIFSGESLTLKDLMARSDWSFITGMWWKISQFLNINTTFTGTLQVVLEDDLLQRLYNSYPDIYKPLVKDIIDFGQKNIIESKTKENKDKIYLKK